MKKITVLLVYIFFLLPNYGQLHAVYIPPDKLTQIKIDGESDDWNWVPQNYYITSEQMKDVILNSKIDKNNWNCKIIVAWNDIKNWVYIVAIIRDNILNVKSIQDQINYFLDDNMQIAVNPDNLGGEYNYKRFSRYYNVISAYITVSAKNKGREFNINSGPDWLSKNPKYLQWNCKITKDHTRKDSIQITYELGMALWDEWTEQSEEFSKNHILTTNQIIRLAIGFNDVDKKRNERVAQWVTSTGPSLNWMTQADNISQFILDPPIKSENPWDGIYQILRP